MKILVLNPPGPFCRAGSRWPHKRSNVGIRYNPFPFFISYATSVLRQNGYNADIKDCIALEWNTKKLLNYIDKFNPDLIVMETSTPSYSNDVEIMKKIKKPVVAVGSHATATFKQHLNDGFDYVAIGEFDFSLLELVKFLDKKIRTFPDTIAYKNNLKPKYPDLIKDLDKLPYPPWDLMPMEMYNEPFSKGRNVTLLSSRGCVHNCSFCTVAVFYGKPNCRVRNPVKVCDEIQVLIDKYRPDEIYFDDDSITIFKDHIENLCREYKKRNFGITFSCMGDCAVKNSTLKIMADSGCRAFKFGVESFTPEVLKRIPKHITVADVQRVVKKCRELDIKTHPAFVLGLPGETLESAKRTIKEAIKLDADTLQFSTAIPYPGTRLYAEAEKNGWFLTKDWNSFSGTGDVVISYPEFTAKEIMDAYREGWVKWERHLVFRKPSTLWKHISGKYKREGMKATLQLIGYGTKKLIKGEKM